jgi:DME family drug/metabolite transporter
MTPPASDSTQSPARIGYLAIGSAAVLFGVAGAVAKDVFNSDVGPITLTALRSIIAAAVMVPLLVLIGRSAIRVTPAQFPVLLGMAILLIGVNITFYASIAYTSVAIAIMLEYSAPVYLLIAASCRLRRAPPLRTTAVLVLAVVSMALLCGVYRPSLFHTNAVGVLWGIACGVAFAGYNFMGNIAANRGIAPRTVTVVTFSISAVAWLPFAALDFEGTSAALTGGTEVLLSVLFVSVFATAIPYWLLNVGLQRVDAFRATMIGMLDPAVAALVAWLLLGEILEPLQVVGIAGLIGALLQIERLDDGAQQKRVRNESGTPREEPSL